MKYLDYPILTAICNQINDNCYGDVALKCNIVAFSCKRVGDDRKESKRIGNDLMKENEFGYQIIGNSKFNDMYISKIYVNLVQTLNATFTDYDFSNTQPDLFICQDNCGLVMNTVNRYLSQIYELQSQHVVDDIWDSIDKIINIHECNIYSYIPDVDIDPLGENNIWSFNYFFYNNKLKKLVFFSCSCKSKFARTESSVFHSPYYSQEVNMNTNDDEEDDDEPMEW